MLPTPGARAPWADENPDEAALGRCKKERAWAAGGGQECKHSFQS
jgi:hypothetical protein